MRSRWPAVAATAALLLAGACGDDADEALPSDTRAPIVAPTEPEVVSSTTIRDLGHVDTVTGVEVELTEVGELRGAHRHGVPARRRRIGPTSASAPASSSTVDRPPARPPRSSTSPTRRPPTASGACSAWPWRPTGPTCTSSSTNLDGDTRIDEYAIAEDGSLDEGSRRIVLALDQPFANHNGGHLAFGPDGMLYIGLGDGGAAGDPLRAGQDLEQLLGSILRIDPNGVDGSALRHPRRQPLRRRGRGPARGLAQGRAQPVALLVRPGHRRPLDRRRRPGRDRGDRPPAGRPRRPGRRAGRQPRLERHGGRPALRGRRRARGPHPAGVHLPRTPTAAAR